MKKRYILVLVLMICSIFLFNGFRVSYALEENLNYVVDYKEKIVISKVIAGRTNLPGDQRSFFITEDGRLYAVGNNEYGELGLSGDSFSNLTLVSIPDNNERIIDASLGYSHSLVLTESGKLYAAGSNEVGELGLGDNNSRDQFVYVMDNVREISAGNFYSLVVTNDNVLYGFGINSYGQLGIEGLSNSNTPVKVMENVKMAVAGYQHSLILSSDGILYATGKNGYGGLGLGDVTQVSVPTRVMGNVRYIDAVLSSVVITNDDVLYGFGLNNLAQLGLGDTINRNTPIKIMENVEGVSVSSSHTLVIGKDDKLYGFGYNKNGELGLEGMDASKTPTYIMDNVSDVSAGAYYSLVLSKGNLYGFGKNDNHQLGLFSSNSEVQPLSYQNINNSTKTIYIRKGSVINYLFNDSSEFDIVPTSDDDIISILGRNTIRAMDYGKAEVKLSVDGVDNIVNVIVYDIKYGSYEVSDNEIKGIGFGSNILDIDDNLMYTDNIRTEVLDIDGNILNNDNIVQTGYHLNVYYQGDLLESKIISVNQGGSLVSSDNPQTGDYSTVLFAITLGLIAIVISLIVVKNRYLNEEI